jgi:hypothetical protein
MTEKKKSIWKRWYMIVLYCFAGLMVLGAILPDTETDSSNQDVNTPTNTLTTEQQMQQDVQKALGSDKIKDFNYYGGDDKLVIINYKASDYSSERTLQNDHIKIYEKLFENYDIESVSIFSWMIFFDSYGQETEMVGVRSMITKETADKINWDNLLTDNLPKVANTYYVHPALKD